MRVRIDLAFVVILLAAAPVSASPILLYEVGFNVDGATYSTVGGGPIDNVVNPLSNPPFDSLGFDYGTGLGFVTLRIAGAGEHFVIGYFDVEYEDEANSRFNEVGSTLNLAMKPANLSWEIGDPFAFDDTRPFPAGVYYNTFRYNQLADTNGALVPNDVAAALGWTFSLSEGQTALVTFVVSPTNPGGFALRHSDAAAQTDVAFYQSTLSITGNQVPEPATWLLVGTGLGLLRRRSLR